MSLPALKKIEFANNPWPDIPYLVLRPENDSEQACLEILLQTSRDLLGLFAEHPELDEEEPWFGWAFQCSEGYREEAGVMERAAENPELRPMMETYVRRVINVFQETEAEPGFYVHEEKEAGSDALYQLLRAEPRKYFDLYLEYLSVIDLEHTVAQHETAANIKQVLTEEQLVRLRDTLAELNGGEYFPEI